VFTSRWMGQQDTCCGRRRQLFNEERVISHMELEEARQISDNMAREKLAAATREPPLVFERWEVKVNEDSSAGVSYFMFNYYWNDDSVRVGPGEGHFSVWVERETGAPRLLPGR